MKYLILSLIILCMVACAPVAPTSEVTSNDDYAEIPFNFEVRANDLPALDEAGTIKIIVQPLIDLEEMNISITIDGGLQLLSNPNWTGSIPAGAPTQLEVQLKAITEGPATITITAAATIRDVPMQKIGIVRVGVGKRGTLVEDLSYSTKMGE
jgi:hypothetical protein